MGVNREKRHKLQVTGIEAIMKMLGPKEDEVDPSG
jgi:hypothetical protein